MINIPPYQETDFLKTAVLKHTDRPLGEIDYLDMVGFEHEKKMEHGEFQQVSLRIFSKVFRLENFQVQSELDPGMNSQAKNFLGAEIDSKGVMISALSNEDQMNREKQLYKKYLELAERTQDLLITPWQHRVRKFFKDLKFPHYVLTGDDLVRKIFQHANMIAIRTRMGPGNFVIVGSEVLSLLEDSPAFIHTPLSGPIKLGAPLFVEVGSINGIKVFRNALAKFNDKTIIVGRTTKENETGVYFVSKDREMMEVVDEISTKTRLILRSRMTIVDTINADKKFLLFEVEIAKKPWWRKLFKL